MNVDVDVDVKFFKSELFSCLPKVDHLITNAKGLYLNTFCFDNKRDTKVR